jgi:hypothetical protein
MAPMAKSNVSTSSSNCFWGLGYVRTEAVVNFPMSNYRAASASFVHAKGTFFFVSSVREQARAAKF